MSRLSAFSAASALALATVHCSSPFSSGGPVAGSSGLGAPGVESAGDDGKSGPSAAGASGHGGSGDGGGSTAGTAGISGDGGAAGEMSPPCDTTKSPSEESCLVSDEYAIFVAPTGTDAAGGTKAAPVKTLAKALTLAGKTKAVIACEGTYDEQVKLSGGVKLYGGFTCPGSVAAWSYQPGKKAKVAPSVTGVALSVGSGAAAVIVEDFEFDAKDGAVAGESSIAAFVNASSNVALTRVKLVAGKGADGANGTGISTPAASGATGSNGVAACTVTAAPNAGGAEVESTCGGAASGSVGGKGGDGATNNASGGNGE